MLQRGQRQMAEWVNPTRKSTAYWLGEARWQDRQKRIAQQIRERALQEAIASVCLAEYRKGRFRALTTPTCKKVFLDSGLP